MQLTTNTIHHHHQGKLGLKFLTIMSNSINEV